MRQATTNEDLDQALKRLWQMDAEDKQLSEMTPEEVWCEKNFAETCHRNIDGRYVVAYAIKPDALELGESYHGARNRFFALERRFARDPELHRLYTEFMDELVDSKHMRIADEIDRNRPHYYIPHHAIRGKCKFRVVLDASMKSSNGRSLNDVQLPGPKIQPDLYELTIKFRMGIIGMTADVKMMYRQVCLVPHQPQLQRIF